ADGCTATSTITINENPSVTATITSSNDVSVFGLCDGDATVSAGGGTGAYSYDWSGGAGTNPVASGLCSGTYTVTVTDGNGCTAVATVTINEPNAIIITIDAITNITCNGDCDGSAQISVTGGVLPYTYLWDDPASQTIEDPVNLCAGTYILTVTDANSATATTLITITENPAVTAVASGIDVSCNGLCDGSASVIGGGGTGLGTYSYLWDDPAPAQTTSTATGLCAGTYNITITDANGCSAIDLVVINEPALLVASISLSNDATCAGLCDGSATVSAIGGISPIYTYDWSDPSSQTTQTATGLCAGTFTVEVTDANGCTSTANVTINQPTAVTASTIVSDAHCGFSDGDATVNGSGGTGAYSYLWDDLGAQITQTAIGLPTGLYNVTVTDINGCIAIATANIGDLSGVTATIIDQTDVSCNGLCDGDATVQGSGGNPPYTYLWDDPSTQTLPVATGLCVGPVNVTVTDFDGCFSITNTSIIEPVSLTASITNSTNVSCNNGNDGSATVTPVGGTTPYTYAWNGGLTPFSPTTAGFPVGTYNVTVTDGNGCTASASVIITEPSPISLNVSGVDENCNQGNGSATVMASGGTVSGDYSYIWDGGSNPTTNNISNLGFGTYSVTVTDDNGCTASGSQIIGNIPAGIASISSFNDVSCNGFCDGSATVSIGGGAAPYSYLWDDPGAQTTTTAIILCPAIYNVSITDNNNCVVTTSVTIAEPNSLSVNISSVNIQCFGDCDGSYTASASGGTATYNYQWDDPALTNSPVVNNLCSGTYHLTVTDNNSCVLIDSVTQVEPIQMTISLDSINDASCGQHDGEIYITVNNGNAPFTYIWNPGGFITEDLIGVQAGLYSVTVTDFRGCIATASYSVNDATGPTATISAFTNVDCFGNCNGTITVSASGGTGIGTYTYLWNDPAPAQTGPTATNLCAGAYNVTVTDANGCIASANSTIIEPPLLVLNMNGISVDCNGGNDGSATAIVTGGTGLGTYTYLWDDPGVQNSATADSLYAGLYNLLVTDGNGCTITSFINITQPAFISLSTSTIDPECYNGTDGTATVLSNGGTGAYTYLWDINAGSQTTQTALGLSDGTYCVTVYDANLCAEPICVTLNEPTELVSSITNFGDVTCNGDADGFAQVFASGGTPGYFYLWNTTDVTPTISNLSGGVYSIVVTDANGCTSLSSISVFEPSPLLLSLNSSDETCFGYCNGYIDALYSGGTAPLNVLWSNMQSSPTAINLCGSTMGLNYSVTITDGNACSISATETIYGPQFLDVINPVVNSASCGQSDGSACVSVVGGTGPTYSYVWENGAGNIISNSLCISNVISGAYYFTVTDFNGCDASFTANINDLSAPVIDSISVVNILCNGDNNGSATVYASGGVGSYDYQWGVYTGYQTTQTAIGLDGGQYTVVVTDDNGCIASGNTIINEPSAMVSAITAYTNASCNGGSNGSITVQAAGGTLPYSYLWAPTGQITPIATGLSAGTYNVIISDNNGCTVTNNQQITQPTQLVVVETITNVACSGGCDGVISLQTSGGTQPATFNWLAPLSSNNFVVANLCEGDYQVVVSDAHACSQTLMYLIDAPDPIVVTTSSIPITCNQANGSVSVDDVTGGNGGYTYLWSPGNHTGSTVDSLTNGTYALQVTDILGCSETVYVDVFVIPVPSSIVVIHTDALCNGGFDGIAEVFQVNGGVPPYTYLWDTNAGSQTSQIALNLHAGLYYVSATDFNGCTIVGQTVVGEPAPLQAYLEGPVQTICIGQWVNIIANASGGTTPYTYYWADTNLVASNAFQTIQPDVTTTYQVYAVDANGCISYPVSLIVSVYPELNVVSSPDVTICQGESIIISADGSGGNGGPYIYQWSSGNGSQISVNPVTTTIYTVTVFDACGTPSVNDSVTVSVVPAPNVNSFSYESGCAPVLVTFTPDVMNSAWTYYWNFGDYSSTNNTSSNEIAYHNYGYGGSYDVSLTVYSAVGCSTIVESTLYVYELPDAEFYATPEIVNVLNAEIEFFDQSTPVMFWQWDFGDHTYATVQNPDHTYYTPGDFIVTLIVRTENNCLDTVQHIVQVQEAHTFYAPSAFSPGSGLQNNYFYPKGIGIDHENYHLIIFDRWGEVIFETDQYPVGTDVVNDVGNIEGGWNGRFRNTGDVVPTGTYTWLVILKDVNGQSHEYVGAVSVIR
ncbi:MAG: PKD domain-containing protein, partial [Bacteroidota bacterium]